MLATRVTPLCCFGFLFVWGFLFGRVLLFGVFFNTFGTSHQKGFLILVRQADRKLTYS